MLGDPGSSTKASPGVLSNGFLLSLLILLALLLGFTTLAQSFFVVPVPERVIRWAELLFVALFLVGVGRRYEPAVVRPTVAGWLFLAWLASSSISVGLASYFGPALFRQAEWLTHILFAFALWSLVRSHAAVLKAILWVIPLGFILVGLHMLAAWFSLPNPQEHDWFIGVPLVGHVRHFGYYALAGLLFSAFPLLGFLRDVSWRDRGLALATMTFCWGFLFWTGGRAAVGTAFIGLALMAGFAQKDQRVWAIGTMLAAVAIGLWVSTLFEVPDLRLGFFNSFERTAAATSVDGVNGFTTGRPKMWDIALRGLEGRYWFGLGPDNYKMLPEATYMIQPHSMFVQFLAEWGVLGAVPFTVLLGLVFWKAFARLRREQDPLRKTARVTAFALMVAATVHSFVDGLYYHALPLLLLFTCFAVTLVPVTSDPAGRAGPRFLALLTGRWTLGVAAALLAVVFLLDVL